MSKYGPYFDLIGEIRTISPKTDKSCFFGYYDLKAYDDTDQYHLCNCAEFEDRIPEPDDILELGVVDIETRNFEKIAETKAWNFQQGALLQWHRQKQDTVFYNVFENGEFMTVQHNVKTGDKKYTPVCANVSRNGKWGLRVNFCRIYDFRPGYGYCNYKDPFYDIAQPENDGVFLVDMETGQEKMILSYPQMAEAAGRDALPESCKLVVNHITFNPAGDRFIILLRSFPVEGRKNWGTTLIASDLEGNMNVLMRNSVYSHYDWEDDLNLFGVCTGDGEHQDLFNVNIDTGVWTRLPKDVYLNKDIHCLFSKDRRCFIGDDYSDKDGYRRIHYYDLLTNENKIIIQDYSPMDWVFTDTRTDLHNRWNTKNDKISYDTIHSGKREICEIDLRGTGLI